MILGSTYSTILHMTILGTLLFGFPNMSIPWPESEAPDETQLRVVVLSKQQIQELKKQHPKNTIPRKRLPTLNSKKDVAKQPNSKQQNSPSKGVRKPGILVGTISSKQTSKMPPQKRPSSESEGAPAKKNNALKAFTGISTTKNLPTPNAPTPQNGKAPIKASLQNTPPPLSALSSLSKPAAFHPAPPNDAISKLSRELADKIPRLKSLREATIDTKQTKEKNPALEQTAKRLKSRSEEGYAHAQYSLAEMILTGDVSDGGQKKAIQLLNRAAIGGYLPAQLALGILSAEGRIMERNVAEAHTWWAIAADQGIKQAREALHKLEKNMTSRDAVEARKRNFQLRQVLVLIHGSDLKKASKSELSDRLRVAATLGDVESVHVLLAQGADADGTDEDGRSAVIEAAWRGYIDIVNTLINDGANLAATDNTGKNSLMWTSINGHHNVAKKLVASGIPINAKDKEGITAIMRAAWNGHVETVQTLLKVKANPHLKDKKGRTALDFSILEGNITIVNILKKIPPPR